MTAENLFLCTLTQRAQGHSGVMYVAEHVAMVFSTGLQSVLEGEDSVPSPGCLRSQHCLQPQTVGISLLWGVGRELAGFSARNPYYHLWV